MKKLLIFAAMLTAALSSSAQYLGTRQIMYFQTQADMVGYVTGVMDGQVAVCQDTKLSYKFDGTAADWNVSDGQRILKSTVVIDGKSSGSYLIYTTPPTGSKFSFYPVSVTFRAVSISGAVTPPTISIGTNGSSYNNIVNGTLITTVLSTVGANGGAPQLAAFSPAIPGSTGIYIKVGTPAVATAYTFMVEISGGYDKN